jgi:CO dehydrogenase maturation factor
LEEKTVGLKLAVSGKGGVGKTSLSGLIARLLAAKDYKVYAIDADPVANLSAALGISEDPPITPISELSDVIAERTGTEPGKFGGIFTLNPRVDDIPDRFSRERDGVHLLVMGTVDKGGSGCICPESVMLKALVNHLVLYRDEVVVMDMEAGIEHLGRATSRAVDLLLTVVEPGARSQKAAIKIKQLAADLGVERVMAIGNRVRNDEDRKRLEEAMADFEFIGFIPVDEEIAQADRDGRRPYEELVDIPQGFSEIVDRILSFVRTEESDEP